MNGFLASLAARAHGLAEVVQPRTRALFEPIAPGNDGAVLDVSDVPTRAAARATSPVEMPLTRRIVEIEHLLATTMPPAPAPHIAALPPDLTRPAAESVPPVPAVQPEPSVVVAAPPVPPVTRPAAQAVVQPVVHVHRAAPAPAPPPMGAAAPASPPAPSAPPSVTIRIERIDVRAVVSPTPLPRTIAAARRAHAQPSLGDYLASRR